MSELRDEDRLVVAYRYFFELSEVEMAAALGCARGTVKSRLSRALGRLRERLGRAERRDPDPEGVTRG
jgi:RNA polymerase sigma-70 factor (ECF subfamily)